MTEIEHEIAKWIVAITKFKVLMHKNMPELTKLRDLYEGDIEGLIGDVIDDGYLENEIELYGSTEIDPDGSTPETYYLSILENHIEYFIETYDGEHAREIAEIIQNAAFKFIEIKNLNMTIMTIDQLDKLNGKSEV